MIAFGLGCRRGAAKDAILEIVRRALSRTGTDDEEIALFSVEDKRDETGLIEAAADLHMPLSFLPRAALRDVETLIVTPSHHAEAVLGLASVSEAAALAGAGRGATLILPRVTGDGVTCAVARGGGR